MSFPKLLSPSHWTLKSSTGRSNADLDPVPLHLQTWTTWSYVSYWISDAANVASWEVASTMLATGLSWKQALPAMAIGYTVLAFLMVLNGTIGARLHVPFPVLARSSFGFWFSYVPVVGRIIIGLFWFAIFTYTGAECVYQMLKAVWPQTANIPNTLTATSDITTVGLLTFFLYWAIQFPFMFVSPHQIRLLFLVKSIVVPIGWIAILVWAFIAVPDALSHVDGSPNLDSTETSWAFLGAINTSLGGWLTLALNIPDFTRYAKNEQAQYVQIAVLPLSLTLVGFLGIGVTAAGNVLYGQMLWDPLQLIDRWTNRPAAFFMALCFLISTLATNISANSLSVANNLMVLCPRYINIRRGQIICAIIGGWALAPWKILASAEGFITFIESYTVFLGPFVAIVATDYWLVRRGRVDVVALYDPHSRYRYWNGINWRAAVAILVSVPPAIPGLVTSIIGGAHDAAYRVFQFDSFIGIALSSLVYLLLSLIFPAREALVKDSSVLAHEVGSLEREGATKTAAAESSSTVADMIQ